MYSIFEVLNKKLPRAFSMDSWLRFYLLFSKKKGILNKYLEVFHWSLPAKLRYTNETPDGIEINKFRYTILVFLIGKDFKKKAICSGRERLIKAK